jgi:hypothetical protein
LKCLARVRRESDSLSRIFNLFALDRQIEAGTIHPLRFPELGYD